MSKEAVIAAIDDAWRDLRRSLERMTTRDMEVPGVCVQWSVKDLLGHITSWEAELIRALLTGDPARPAAGVHGFNAHEAQKKSSVPAHDILVELEETHRALRTALAEAPDEQFTQGHPQRRRIDEDTVLHYEEHATQIRVWADGRR